MISPKNLSYGLVAFGLIVGCAQSGDEDKRGQSKITKEEIATVPDAEAPGAISSSAKGASSGSLNFGDEIPLDIHDDETAAAPSGGLSLAGEIPQFREWYSKAVEPSKSKYIDVTCGSALGKADPRIVFVTLSEVAPAAKELETAFVRINACDKVNYGFANLTAGTKYAVKSRIYRVIPDKTDPTSSIFDTLLLLEGSTIGFDSTSKTVAIGYRRVVDPDLQLFKAQVVVTEGGQNENDILRGGAVKILVNGQDANDPAKLAPVAKATVVLDYAGKPDQKSITLTTDAQGVATTSNLATGIWKVIVKANDVAAGQTSTFDPTTSKIEVKANAPVDHEVKLSRQIYGWAIHAVVTVDPVLKLQVKVAGHLNEKPGPGNGHAAYALPLFYKYCAAKVAAMADFPYAKQASEKLAAGKPDSTFGYKYLSADGKKVVAQNDPNFAKLEGARVNWPADGLAVWGGGGCRILPAK